MKRNFIFVLILSIFLAVPVVYGEKADTTGKVVKVSKTRKKEIPAGMFLKMKGNIGVKRANSEKWLIAEEYMPIYSGDRIKTLEKSWAEVIFDNGVGIKIEEKTVFNVEKMEKDTKSTENSIKLKSGFILSDVKKVSKILIHTPTAVAAIRGTLFVVSVDTSGNSEVCVFKGTVTVVSQGKDETEGVTCTENSRSLISEKAPPSKPDVLDEKLTSYRDTIALKYEIAIESYREKIDELIKQRDTWIENLQKQRENKIENLQKRQDDLLKKLQK